LSGKQTAPRGSLVNFSLLKTNEKTGYGFEPVLCNKWIVWQTVSKLKPVWMHQIRPKLCQLLIQTIGFHGNIHPNIEMEEITEFPRPRPSCLDIYLKLIRHQWVYLFLFIIPFSIVLVQI
jgi:hypothetical protein